MRNVKAMQDKRGFIYFISDTKAIKIGFSAKSPMGRLRDMQTGHPLPLILVGSIPGCAYEEFVIHNRFAHLRLKGEWFVIEEDLLQFIADFRVAGVLIQPEESRLAERMQNWQRRHRETWKERHDAQ